jgi:hypothetical protein
LLPLETDGFVEYVAVFQDIAEFAIPVNVTSGEIPFVTISELELTTSPLKYLVAPSKSAKPILIPSTEPLLETELFK